jgi:hypothetical protein
MMILSLRKTLASLILLGIMPFAANTAQADENLWGYVYGAETLPKGKTEAYLWITDRRNKAYGHYDAQDYALELEHGFTDRLQASIYLNLRSHNIKDSAPLEPDGSPEYPNLTRSFGFQGIQTSLKWNILSPYKDGWGLAVYVEPGYSRIFKISGQKQDELALELKLLLQKNFLDDQLIFAFNWTLEQEFRKLKIEDSWSSELEMEFTTGLSYRFAPNWYAGVEGRYHSEYPDFPNTFKREHFAFFAGPNLHYGGKKWWATLTYFPQLYGKPQDNPVSNSLHLAEHEKREVRFKIGYNF